MHPDFWHERWQQGQIGFHQPDYHAALLRYWPGLGASGRALVPLCGRSLDMAWLAAHGHPVTGVELSPIAAEGFFAHEGIAPQMEGSGAFRRYFAGSVEILQGDFFDLRAEDVVGLGAWYDRAALIALPPPMRLRYARRIGELLPPGSVGLLIVHEYDQSQMDGPPFSVEVSEVEQLFGADFDIELLERRETISEAPRFAERGLDSFVEAVMALRR